MALTQKRREELADIVDRGASWIGNRARAAILTAVAAELRTGDVPEEAKAEEERRERLAKEAEEANAAAEKLAEKRADDAAAAKAKADERSKPPVKATTKKAAAPPS